MYESLSHWWELIVGAIGSFIGALGGVLLRRSHEYQQGDRAAWGKLLLDFPTIFVMGLIGAGIGTWLHLNHSMPELFGYILSSILGYLGPKSIDRIVSILERRVEGNHGDDGKGPGKGDESRKE